MFCRRFLRLDVRANPCRNYPKISAIWQRGGKITGRSRRSVDWLASMRFFAVFRFKMDNASSGLKTTGGVPVVLRLACNWFRINNWRAPLHNLSCIVFLLLIYAGQICLVISLWACQALFWYTNLIRLWLTTICGRRDFFYLWDNMHKCSYT